jgi:hypothetical protein
VLVFSVPCIHKISSLVLFSVLPCIHKISSLALCSNVLTEQPDKSDKGESMQQPRFSRGSAAGVPPPLASLRCVGCADTAAGGAFGLRASVARNVQYCCYVACMIVLERS